MNLQLDDTSRMLLITFLHGIFPLLLALGAVELDERAIGLIQGMISTGVTLVFYVFRRGQEGVPDPPAA